MEEVHDIYHAAAAVRTEDIHATRFIKADNYGKSYDDITELLGNPSVIKDINQVNDRGNKYIYIAYRLIEGQQRYAYFVLRNDKVIEEGVMYGDDYATVNEVGVTKDKRPYSIVYMVTKSGD